MYYVLDKRCGWLHTIEPQCSRSVTGRGRGRAIVSHWDRQTLGRTVSRTQRRLITVGLGIVGVACCSSVLAVGLLTSILPASLSAPKFNPVQPLGQGEVIAFSYMRPDILRPFELYVVDDAHGIRSLSQGLARSDVGPVWSPDGRQLAYQSTSGGSTRYHLVDADGAHRREITSTGGRHNALLRWSPDGSRLAYLAYEHNPDRATIASFYLYVTEVATGATRRAPVGQILDLAWMPAGDSVLVVARAEDSVSIERYDAGANHERRISMAEYLREARTVSLSPDATKVAYVSPAKAEGSDTTTDALYVALLDGSAITSLATPWLEGAVVWSPDSTRLAFVALTDDLEYALYVASAEGAGSKQLMLINTGDESGEILPAAPAWSPDGARIAISSFSGPEGPALYIVNADGTAVRQITTVAHSGGMIYDLAWRPGN